MKRTFTHRDQILKSTVTGLRDVVIVVVGGFAPCVSCPRSNAQEISFRSKTVQGQSVQPIQRKTANYRKVTKSVVASSAPKIDWTTLPSTYTHAPDGQRVDQFVAVAPEPILEIPANARSGYRHTRSTLQAGFSSDNYHAVEQWGAPVRPYGEWRFPNRPFAVPYGAWGPQLPQVVGGGFGFFPGPFPMQPHQPMNPQIPGQSGAGGGAILPGGSMPPGQPYGPPPLGYPQFGISPFGFSPFGVGPQNGLAPTQDDYYPQAPMLKGPMMDPHRYHPLTNGLE